MIVRYSSQGGNVFDEIERDLRYILGLILDARAGSLYPFTPLTCPFREIRP